MKPEVNKDIFKRDALIRTKVRDEAPTFYHKGSNVSDCIVADGCDIKGTVENSILFRGVVVEEGAVVRNSIIMQGTHISKNAAINYAIIDKNVEVSNGTALTGAPLTPILVHKGQKI